MNPDQKSFAPVARHNTNEDYDGPYLVGVSGDGGLWSGPGSLDENRPRFHRNFGVNDMKDRKLKGVVD
jgi:hypothetical protein